MSAAGRLALAVILAWLMPWQAVREVRRYHGHFAYLCDVIVSQDRAIRELRGEQKPRHLRLVQ